MQNARSSGMTKSKDNQSLSSLAFGTKSFSSKSSVSFANKGGLQSIINSKNLGSEQPRRNPLSSMGVSGNSIVSNNYSISELEGDFDMPCKLNSNMHNSVSSTIGNIFQDNPQIIGGPSQSNNAKEFSYSQSEHRKPRSSNNNNSNIKLGPNPSFRSIKLNCLQTSNLMNSNSVEFQLNLISELKKGIKFSTKEAELVKIPTSPSKSISEISSNETVNNILNYARNTTILTTRSKSSQYKLKKSRKFFCCSSLKNSNKELNKSYLSTNITRKSGNYSVKSMVMNDSLSRFRKKKSASIKSDKKLGTCAGCTIF